MDLCHDHSKATWPCSVPAADYILRLDRSNV